jgi:hypothetical protein
LTAKINFLGEKCKNIFYTNKNSETIISNDSAVNAKNFYFSVWRYG